VSESSSAGDGGVDFERVLAEYGPALRRVAASYERLPGPRAELLQEIALALWLALPRFRGACSIKTFVFRVAHNRAISYSCRPKRLRTTTVDEAAGVKDPGEGPEDRIARLEARDRLEAAVGALPLVQRQVASLTLEDSSPISRRRRPLRNAVAIRRRARLRDRLELSRRP
jgi:RNA polymerase sigma-70 factor (ECF subfamily)